MDRLNATLTRRELLRTLAVTAAAAALPASPLRAASPQPSPPELILCGADEVFILSGASDAELSKNKIWSWKAADCPDIPASLKRAFRTTTDCKPIEGGRKILISSSSGALALVERATGRAPFFYSPVPNAHSIELLPGGRVAAAASVAPSPQGNRIVIFDISSRKELAADRLVSAHGLAWDEPRQLLWALGNNTLRAYRVPEGNGGKFTMKIEFETTLPEDNGHDLVPLPGTDMLFISTGHRCWIFDRATRRLAPHDTLADTEEIKSYSVQSATGRVAYIQAEGSSWWTERVHLLNPKGILHLPGQRLYKARWM